MTNNEDQYSQDADRTMRSHAGEAISDNRNWPGYILIGTGIVVLGLALVAAGYGFEGWAVIAGAVCVLGFIVGVVLVLLERRRVKKLEGKELTDQGGQ
ncbi:MAG: hypothetical protein WAW17_02390 [Rhodococcus sp. (in: high G+C Gram-positive bacteria)]|uniref:hypothetical protein n=1 Tax=Rhodococcus sp. TaxID=1831 RepID=UPI003BAFC119